MTPLWHELIRQVLRWLGVWLMTAGWLPAPMAEMVSDVGTSEFVIGVVSYLIADVLWAAKKAKDAAQ